MPMSTFGSPARLFALLGAVVAVTCALPAVASAQESGDGPPFSFPGCTEQADGNVDCGYQGPEADPPPNCSRPDEGGQLTCYPGGLSAQASGPESPASDGDCVDASLPCDDTSEPTAGEDCPPGQEDENGVCPDAEQQPGPGPAGAEASDDETANDDESASGGALGASGSSASDPGSSTNSSGVRVESVQLARTGSPTWLLLLLGTTSLLASVAVRSLSSRRSVGA